ncbi:MAG: glycosyltransferase [Chitinophagales bacterium]|nr:glycosyltransferase [Chitinophagales bacterium]
MPLCSIVLTNYNGLKNGNLPRFLNRIWEACKSNKLCDELILVDDGSSDESCDFIRSGFPDIKLISLITNRGFAIAANAGFAACRNPYAALISNDMVPASDWLNFLMPQFSDPEIFAVSARLIYENGNPQSYRRAVKMKWGRLKRYHTSSQPTDEDAKGKQFHHFGDAWSLLDVNKFHKMGGFDPLFLPFFSEDEDLFYRAWKNGWKVCYEPRSKVIHCHEFSTIYRATSDKGREQIYRGHQFLYTWKNLDDPIFRAQHFISIAIRFLISWCYDTNFYHALKYAWSKKQLMQNSRLNRPNNIFSDKVIMRKMLTVINLH